MTLPAGDTLQRITLMDQWIFDSNGDLVGIKNPRASGNDFILDPANPEFDTLTVTGNATVGGTLGVTGNATVGGTLGVTGAASAASFSAGGLLAATYSTKLLLAGSSVTDNFAAFVATNGAGRTYYMGPGVGDGVLSTFTLYDNTSGATRWRSTATGFDVTGSISATANSASPAAEFINSGAGFALRATGASQVNGYIDVQGTAYVTAGAFITGLTTTDTLRVNVTPTAEVVVATHTAVFNINGTNYKFLCLAA